MVTIPPGSLSRVAVIGTSCCGKTTLARRLSEILGHVHIELDALHWRPNWTERDPTEFRALVAGEVTAYRWVVDGNYSVVRDLVWPRATAIVWLNYPFGVVFGRALRRTFRRAVHQEELFSGNRESLRRSLFSRESILWWVIATHGGRRRRYRDLLGAGRLPHLAVHEFIRPKDAEAFLCSLGQRDEPAAR